MNRKSFSIVVTVLALLALAWLLRGRTAWAAADPPPAITGPSGDSAAGGGAVRPPNAPSGLLSTYTVTNTNDSGVGSLHWAIAGANENSGPDTINFNIIYLTDPGCDAGTHVCTITPTVALPALTDGGTTIDGYTQFDASYADEAIPAALKIQINGANAGALASGLTIRSANNVVKGLVINRFSGYGIEISGAAAVSNTIAGNHIGTDVSGSSDFGNALSGVAILSGAQNNTIGGGTPGERNVISGNDQDGVTIEGSGTASNTISGNYIGLDAYGSTARGNSQDGVYIGSGAQNNTVGGGAEGERNLISCNGRYGVDIGGSGTMSNTVSGNYIGADRLGTTDRGNAEIGVAISDGARNNMVGGDTPGKRNLISGNDQFGVAIGGLSAMSNTVSGNYIGTTANGLAKLGNTVSGVYIGWGTQNNTVGGHTQSDRNVISGNGGDGVVITGSGTMSNTVSANYIGTTFNGTADLGNAGSGVHIENGAQNNTVGGDAAGERNLISYNDRDGVTIQDNGTRGNIVSGNYIGTDPTYLSDQGNAWSGVYVGYGAQNNTVGGSADGERNVISGNDWHGVEIGGSGTMSNTVSGNYIGVAADGATARGNSQSGVYIGNHAQNNMVGGDADGERNIISGNNEYGVHIHNTGTTGNTVSGNTVSGNYIGVAADGTTAQRNLSGGVYIQGGAQNNTVGGDTPGERNIISGNNMYGVAITGTGTTSNTVSGNYIGVAADGATARGNTDGVGILGGAQNNTVGGSTDGKRNVISGNDGSGVEIAGGGTTGNAILGNTIGTDKNGAAGPGNGHGVYISDGAQNNVVGGDTAGERNLISGNNQDGVTIVGSGTASNTISGNYIGTDKNGMADLGNAHEGVSILDGAQNNMVGGHTAGERNVISGNNWRGVYIAGPGTMSNTLSGNYVGVGVNGTTALSNTLDGVYIYNGAGPNTIGPGNIIAHNGGDGVAVDGSTGNTITHNSIYSNTKGIYLTSGANGGILTPVIVTTTAGSVNVVGTACAGCIVEVFSNGDTDGEGETYMGSGTATVGGIFTVTLSALYKPYLTATATDAAQGTSKFSAVFTSTVRGGKLYLPVVIKMQ